MYEMYPDAWLVATDRRGLAGATPRRRARKAHSVLPAVIAHLEQRDADSQRAAQQDR